MNTLQYEIIVLSVFFACSLLLCISIYLNQAGEVGKFINNLLFGLFGIGAYLIPLLIIIASLFKIFNKGNQLLNNRIYLGGILVFTISVSAHVMHMKDAFVLKINGANQFFEIMAYYYKNSTNRVGGGFVGGLFGDLLVLFIGPIGTYIVLILGSIILVILLTEKSLFTIIKLLSTRIKEASEQAIEKTKEARERMIEEYAKEEEEDKEEDKEEDDDKAISVLKKKRTLRKKSNTQYRRYTSG